MVETECENYSDDWVEDAANTSSSFGASGKASTSRGPVPAQGLASSSFSSSAESPADAGGTASSTARLRPASARPQPVLKEEPRGLNCESEAAAAASKVRLSVSVPPSSGVSSFEVVIAEVGEKVWSDDACILASLPPQLRGSSLLRGSKGALKATLRPAVSIEGSDARIYLVLEVPPPGPIPPGLEGSSALVSGWLPESTTVACTWHSGEALAQTLIFSKFVARGTTVTLPEVASPGMVLVVPILTGRFQAAVDSSSQGPLLETVMEENVTAWLDRDHCYLSVPDYLLGGILFQGPFKDVPEGTVVTVRPNASARVYVIFDKSSCGGLDKSLAGGGWQLESTAPRWHDADSMLVYGRDCKSGWQVELAVGKHAIFSIVLVPKGEVTVAPLEMSLSHERDLARTGGAVVQTAGTLEVSLDFPAKMLTLGRMEEGLELKGAKLEKVPGWMLAAPAIYGEGLPEGSQICLRLAAPSVVYVILEVEAPGGGPGRHGGLLTQLPADGFELRGEAPLRPTPEGKSQLAVFGRRLAAQEPLCLPALQTAAAYLAVAAKVDIEAFDASLSASNGLQYATAKLEESCLIWSDRMNRITWLPPYIMTGAIYFRGPFGFPSFERSPSGQPSSLRISGSGAFRAYIAVESSYKGASGPLKARDGGLLKLLPNSGWTRETGAPGWGDPSSSLTIFSRRCPQGSELQIPVGEAGSPGAVLIVAVVSVTSSPERAMDEVKSAFKVWDSKNEGGIRREDLGALLQKLCPAVPISSREALLQRCRCREVEGVVPFEDFLDVMHRLALPGAQAAA